MEGETMGYVIERTDGTTDGLGDRLVFESEEQAAEQAAIAFGRDWSAGLRIVEVDEVPTFCWICGGLGENGEHNADRHPDGR